MAAYDNIVYTVAAADFDAGGTTFSVSSVRLNAVANGIPTCAVGISAEKGAKENTSKVFALTIEGLAETLQSLQNKAMQLATCNLHVKLASTGKISGTKPGVTLNLAGWLLIGVGMSDLTTTDAYSLTCIIAHPAYKLTLASGCMYTGVGGINFSDISKNISNPLDAAKKAIQAIQKANGSQPKQKLIEEGSPSAGFSLKTLQAMRDEIAGRMGATSSAIDSYLEWDGGSYVSHGSDIPGASVMGDCLDGVKFALVRDWAHALFNMSAWNALESVIAPTYGLEVLATYHQEKLVVCPAMPWKDTEDCTVTLKDNLAYSVLLPGQDKDPIFGYMAQDYMQAPGGGLFTVYSAGSEKTVTTPQTLAFIPEGVSSSVGRITQINIPEWIAAARQLSSQKKSTKGTGGKGRHYQSGFLSAPTNQSSGDNKQLGKLYPGVLMHFENRFVLDFRRTVEATLRCPLCIKAGNTIFPGQRLKFLSKGKPVFYGTIMSLQHIISCASSTAETRIGLAYCSFDGGAEGSVLGKSPVAPYYNATGSITF